MSGFLKPSILSVALLCSLFPSAQEKENKLIILLVVDQMRADYLIRFNGYFNHGFDRLLNEGVIFDSAFHDHAFTGTAPGHASIATGYYPSSHGVTENNFYDRKTLQKTYAVVDSSYFIVNSTIPGGAPSYLLKPTVGDLLKKKSKKSKVFAVALKDRASVLMGGKSADAAYWYDSQGNMISSTYYMDAYPPWVNAFNEDTTYLSNAMTTGWKKTYSNPDVYLASRKDELSNERIQWGFRKEHLWSSTFPHLFDNLPAPQQYLKPIFYNLIWRSPFGDELVLNFIKQLIQEEKLGLDDHPDILMIGCSAADAIGHGFGPLSHEVQDYFIKLDQYLGTFFEFLDRSIGKDQYTVILTSDHGVMPMPEELIDRGIEAKRVKDDEFKSSIKKAAKEASEALFIDDELLNHIDFEGVTLNTSLMDRLDIGKIRLTLADALANLDFIEEAYTYDELKRGEPDSEKEFFQSYHRSFYAPRSHDIILQYKKNHLITFDEKGTSHGSPYAYDSHVPLIIWSNSIQGSTISQRISTVDIAPTIMDILAIGNTKEMDGSSLTHHLKRQ